MSKNYQDERVIGARVSDSWHYRGMKTVILENQFIKLYIIADKGADISSFVYKPTDTEMMFKTPWGVRNPSLSTPSTGDPESVWLDYYEGGWQTVVPHGGYPTKYYGADYGIHGDVNNIPWDTKILIDTPELCKIEFIGRSMRSPFEIKRVISLKSNERFIEIEQEVKNYGEEDLDIVWLEHIAIGGSFLTEKCTLTVPDCTILTHPTDADKSSKLKPNFSGNWPFVDMKNGKKSDFRKIPGKSDRSLDMAYFTDLSEGWYSVTNKEIGLSWAVEFPKDLFKYIWYWRNFGGSYGYPFYGRSYNAGLEPCTSWHNDGVKEARNNGTALPVKAGAFVSAKMKAGIILDYSTKQKKNPFIDIK